MLKLGIVVQRYGREVVGGAETLARDVAERLNAAGSDVTVFTTTARDYITWENHFPPAESILKGVIIKRFPVPEQRDIEAFNAYSQHFFSLPAAERDEMDWITRQGPYCPQLIEALDREQKNFDLFLFFTYLYFPTIAGMKVIQKPICLFPTAHDELPIYLRLMGDVFHRPEILFFLTGAEMELVKRLFNPGRRLELVRTGLDLKNNVDEKLFRRKYLQFAPYILYAGRIERGKGLEMVFDAYREIKQKRLIDLVLIGKKWMDIPPDEGIKYLGYVSDEEKLAAFKGALLSVQPSPLESLSITTLESFSQQTPVLVNRQSPVLCEHIDLSGGGFTFDSVAEFADHFYRLNDKRKTRNEMGMNGYRYVQAYYSWPVVIDKIKLALTGLLPGLKG